MRLPRFLHRFGSSKFPSPPEPLREIAEDRELTPAERELATWMLTHGLPGARDFIPQLDKARVVSRCGCGCASIDFGIAGVPRVEGRGMTILGDFMFERGEESYGAFIFSTGEALSGIEVYGLTSGPTCDLPAPKELQSVNDVRPWPRLNRDNE